MSTTSDTAVAVASVNVVAELRTAWQEYQTVERKGLAFGKRLYELRADVKAQGNHLGDGFLPKLQQVGIPQRTAYYWIHSYEISIGDREPKAAKPVDGGQENVAASRAEPTPPSTLTVKPSAPTHKPVKVIPEYGDALQRLRQHAKKIGVNAQVTHTAGKFSVTVLKTFKTEKDVMKFLGGQQ